MSPAGSPFLPSDLRPVFPEQMSAGVSGTCLHLSPSEMLGAEGVMVLTPPPCGVNDTG